ncbi:hypothetical protein I6Y99_003332 [Vibrio parahaemolyticus]|uniref:Uncharacterized protein n=2 Tax=Vibrio parahaemolyticus TaxID=670 RepID=A0A7Y0S4V1_VIBPH|nr:hypothetical protein [Vibrio parahaemolyticus]EGQ7792757.1 hypothetical protein [Vibrio parahaemolyticus]EGQ7809347.1 hypothetical protein [Vibrio parahaemolyticus]EGQ8533251.1 hypothetical protein [Vibrio parahaemolyticus]EHC7287152.1 hypothetical protein [Vibrio parahaemolyticus]EIV8648092.1 hypothetical protein [Vibrio parahaemolyticus]
MFLKVIFLFFFVFPALLGVISHYNTPDKYHALMKQRRLFKRKDYFIFILTATYMGLLVAICIAFLFGKIEHLDAINKSATISIIAVIAVTIWGGVKIKIFAFAHENWKGISALFGGISFLFSIYINEIVNGIIVQTTKYHASDFLVSQSSLSIIVSSFFGVMLLLGAMTLALYVVVFVLFAITLRSNTRAAKGMYAIFRVVTYQRIAKRKAETINHAFVVGMTTCFVIGASVMVLSQAMKYKLQKDWFDNIVVERLVESAYFSKPTDCINIKPVEGLRVAMLTRDRVSFYMKGAEPEFSKGVCISEPSKYTITKLEVDSSVPSDSQS